MNESSRPCAPKRAAPNEGPECRRDWISVTPPIPITHLRNPDHKRTGGAWRESRVTQEWSG
ncbi:hypothetical protein E2C01_074724 [Portunus trituberculatus]|uniref:Uncharacterized protein n=1 Tax=Portunus trituberculatus TaxID=210409 RepID=A0A5B7ID69_PORTR|nr:hypothetical protein [Portunus trituberculatus]